MYGALFVTDVLVTPVRSRADRKAFVDLPFRLHAGTPWIPPLKLERHLFLSTRFNAFFAHGEAELFLARRGGRVVGRISAHVDRAFNAYQGNEWGFFGFLELEEDPEALRALLAAAEAWLRSRGRDRMVGPMDFTANDECGVLIEGFDREPMVRMPWHPPYYQALLEDAGAGALEKEIDLLMWELDISDRDKVLPVIVQLAEDLGPKHGVRIRHMTQRSLRRDMDRFAEVYNAAWSRNWGFTPYSKKDLDAYTQEMRLVFHRDWFMVAEKEDTGETVAVAITVPDVNQALKRMRGRLLPLGWWHFLRRFQHVDRCRVGFLGVKPEFQHTGVAAGLYMRHFEMAAAGSNPVTWGEMGWILETNEPMNRGMEAMGGRVVKRYRVLRRVFAG
jgi:GNAT superfamily N-acetyltransferase